jgi:hypothetical protein
MSRSQSLVECQYFLFLLSVFCFRTMMELTSEYIYISNYDPSTGQMTGTESSDLDIATNFGDGFNFKNSKLFEIMAGGGDYSCSTSSVSSGMPLTVIASGSSVSFSSAASAPTISPPSPTSPTASPTSLKRFRHRARAVTSRPLGSGWPIHSDSESGWHSRPGSAIRSEPSHQYSGHNEASQSVNRGDTHSPPASIGPM